MWINYDGLVVIAFAGLGALLGCALVVPFAIASIWFPGAMQWAWILPVVLTFAGAVLGFITERR